MHDRAVIREGTLVAMSPSPADWVEQSATESSVLHSCKGCKTGVRTLYPATVDQIEGNLREFERDHVCEAVPVE